MERFLGYRRDQDGCIVPIDCEIDDDGELYAGVSELEITDETVELLGWPDEGKATVCVTGGGVEVLVPTRRLP